MPVADSTSIIRQCRIITGRSVFSRGHAKPTAMTNAPVQRQYASATGGTCPAIPRARTMLPAQKRLAATSSPQAEYQNDRNIGTQHSRNGGLGNPSILEFFAPPAEHRAAKRDGLGRLAPGNA